MKRLRCLGLVVLVCVGGSLLSTGTAGAIPIASLTLVKPYKPTLRFTARLVSPSTAANCTAAATASLERWTGGRYIVARKLPAKNFNVCPQGNTGTTYAPIAGTFVTRTLPAGRYRVCVGALQVLRDGRDDYDVNCKVAFLPSR